MHLLVIGSDRNLFKKNSDIWNRYSDYGKLFEEIHVIVFSHKDLGNKDAKIGENVFIYPTNHICKLFYLWNICSISGQVIKNLKFKIKNYRDNIVVSSQDPFESGLAGWMLKKIYKIPLQLQIHTDFLSPYFWQESFINKLRVIFAKFLIPRADGIRVVSERIKQSLVKNFPIKLFCHSALDAESRNLDSRFRGNDRGKIKNLKIDVLPILIDVEAIKSAQIKADLHKKYPQFDFIILMASRLTKEKNIGLALEAMAELVKKYPKLGLVIVGSGPERETLQKLIVKSQLSNVVIEPFVAQDTLFSYYKTADLYLLTSNYEGYGRSVMEAMAAGLPVVMSGVGLAGEVVEDGENGVVFPVGDEKALVSAVELLIKDNKRRNLFSLEGKKTLENLITKEQYLKLYKESFN
ncbi:MAG: glycosyltransferase family 4 protein [bacterium]|nr:glycosyltransferase family 4 protein [bacterium]